MFKKVWPKVLALVLVCIGILGIVLLPWEYVLYEGEDYKITQTATGGKMTIFNYEDIFAVPSPDNILSGVVGKNMEEIADKVLSGDISWNEMYFIASAPEIEFPGMDRLYTPRLPEGIVVGGGWPVWWNVDDCEFSLSGNVSLGSISYCNKKTCFTCNDWEKGYKKFASEKEPTMDRYKIQLYNQNGRKAIVCVPDRPELTEDTRLWVWLWGTDNGIGYHAEITIANKYFTEDMLSQFGMEPYYSEHPRIQAVRNINMARRLCVVLVVAGAALLLYSFLPKRKKSRIPVTVVETSDAK